MYDVIRGKCEKNATYLYRSVGEMINCILKNEGFVKETV